MALDDPLGTLGTLPQGISGNNIVGYYIDAGGKAHGFLYNGSTYTTINYPVPSPLGTVVEGINGHNLVGLMVLRAE